MASRVVHEKNKQSEQATVNMSLTLFRVWWLRMASEAWPERLVPMDYKWIARSPHLLRKSR